MSQNKLALRVPENNFKVSYEKKKPTKLFDFLGFSHQNFETHHELPGCSWWVWRHPRNKVYFTTKSVYTSCAWSWWSSWSPQKKQKKKTDPKAYKPKWGFDSATIWKIFGEDGSKWIFLELGWKVSQWWHSSFPFRWRYIREVSGGKVPISQRNRHNTRSPNIARATKSQNPRLPNTAPVTTSDWQRLSMITNTMPAKSQNSRSPNIARYCNCCYCDD